MARLVEYRIHRKFYSYDAKAERALGAAQPSPLPPTDTRPVELTGNDMRSGYAVDILCDLLSREDHGKQSVCLDRCRLGDEGNHRIVRTISANPIIHTIRYSEDICRVLWHAKHCR
jgi:hypothetical protein